MLKQIPLNKILPSIVLCLTTLVLQAQQNTILIIADDVSPDYFSCFGTNTDTANTPNINALARKGVRFSMAWSAPVCSPARASILTGRYPFRTGVGGVITSANSPQLDTSEMSVAKLLKYYAPNKYQTACIGKWHLTLNTPQKRLNPNKLGFDLYSGNFNGAIPNYYNYTRIRNGLVYTVTTYAITQTVNEAIDWLNSREVSKPFFLWLAFNAPHDPFHIPPPNLCDTSGLKGTTADINAYPKKYFKAALQAMDSEIGRLLQYLENQNLSDSTHIIFIGDNGNQREVAQISNTSKSKGTIYHYGVHVPLVISGPGLINTNRTCSEPVNGVDLFATICELSGFQNWQQYIPSQTIFDSKSLLPILKGQTVSTRTWIFAETFNNPTTSSDGKTIRNKEYHLLRFDNGNQEFYKISSDPEETNNLLANAGNMSVTDKSNYLTLCDTLAQLTGISTCLSLTIQEHLNVPWLTVYPNPSNGLVVIESLKPELEIKIYNAKGQQILQQQINDLNKTIDISHYAPGLYYLSVKSNELFSHQVLIRK